MVSKKENSNAIAIAVVGGVVAIIVAIIQFVPWKSKETLPAASGAPQLVFAGTVVEKVSNNSIGQADIEIVGKGKHYFSEGNGNFRIILQDTTLKSIRVRVTKDSYGTFDQSFDLPEDGAIIPLPKAK